MSVGGGRRCHDRQACERRMMKGAGAGASAGAGAWPDLAEIKTSDVSAEQTVVRDVWRESRRAQVIGGSTQAWTWRGVFRCRW